MRYNRFGLQAMTGWGKHAMSPNHNVSLHIWETFTSSCPLCFSCGSVLVGLGDVFIEKGSHSLCDSQAGLELMEILNARITGVSPTLSSHVFCFCLVFFGGVIFARGT